MTNEHLEIWLSDNYWKIKYVGVIPVPAAESWKGIYTSEFLEDAADLGRAIKAARDWADDNGFIIRAPKIQSYGNKVTMKLVRP